MPQERFVCLCQIGTSLLPHLNIYQFKPSSTLKGGLSSDCNLSDAAAVRPLFEEKPNLTLRYHLSDWLLTDSGLALKKHVCGPFRSPLPFGYPSLPQTSATRSRHSWLSGFERTERELLHQTRWHSKTFKCRLVWLHNILLKSSYSSRFSNPPEWNRWKYWLHNKENKMSPTFDLIGKDLGDIYRWNVCEFTISHLIPKNSNSETGNWCFQPIRSFHHVDIIAIDSMEKCIRAVTTWVLT